MWELSAREPELSVFLETSNLRNRRENGNAFCPPIEIPLPITLSIQKLLYGGDPTFQGRGDRIAQTNHVSSCNMCESFIRTQYLRSLLSSGSINTASFEQLNYNQSPAAKTADQMLKLVGNINLSRSFHNSILI